MLNERKVYGDGLKEDKQDRVIFLRWGVVCDKMHLLISRPTVNRLLEIRSELWKRMKGSR